MELNQFIQLIKDRKQTIISLAVVFFMIGLIVTLAQTLKYESKLRLLVVQEMGQTKDAYALTRSNEYISGVLSEVAHSNSFYDSVIGLDFDINTGYFGKTAKQQNKIWQKTVEVDRQNDSGIIQVSAYHPNKDQAENIARAVAHVLMTRHTNYHGLGDQVSIKLLDQPITSSYPARPNVLLNLIASIIIGLIFSLAYIYLFPERKNRLKWFSKKDKSDPEAYEQSAPMPGFNPNGSSFGVIEEKPTDYRQPFDSDKYYR